MERTGEKWNREETILAFDLYCRIPFSKIGQTNPDVIELANLLGRTPGSVGLKMHNLAHYDPVLQKRNVVAMKHGSRLDGEIFSEFAENWTELSYQAQLIRARYQKQSLAELVDLGDVVELPAGEYKEQLTKSRVGQYFFRMTVLNSYNNCCCVTGLDRRDLLIASHIKPWKVSNEKTERTNPHNGLCLNAFHDRAFDCGLITISTRYCVVVSEKLKKAKMDSNTREWLASYDKKEIILPQKFLPGKEFIEYHNDVIFQK